MRQLPFIAVRSPEVAAIRAAAPCHFDGLTRPVTPAIESGPRPRPLIVDDLFDMTLRDISRHFSRATAPVAGSGAVQ